MYGHEVGRAGARWWSVTDALRMLIRWGAVSVTVSSDHLMAGLWERSHGVPRDEVVVGKVQDKEVRFQLVSARVRA